MIEALRSETASDRVPTHVHGFTATGLVELTRERGRAALSEILFEDWADEGPGRMARAETVAFDVLRAARRQGMGRHGALRALVSPVVASYLAHEGLADLRAVEAELARTLCIDTDPALAQDRYSIAAL